MDKENRIMLLFQLADSAFPIGGFAYSSGMESALKQGFFENIQHLRDYLKTFAEQVISFDFPFVCSAFESDPGSEYFIEEIKKIENGYSAMLLNPPIYRASSITGINWMKIIRHLDSGSDFKYLDNFISANQICAGFPVVFGLSMKSCGFTLHESLNLFFYMSLRDQISAMIRLSITGPSMAHKELKNLLIQYAAEISTYKPMPYCHAVKSGYLLDLVQLTHDRVYSKLFQN